MDYKEYRPPKEIAHLVECFWTNTLHPEDFQHEYDYIIPDGSAEAIFMINGSYLRDDERNGVKNLVEYCSFVPPFRHTVKVYQKPYTECFSIRFKPEAIEALTDTTLGELEQPVYPLEWIMPEIAHLVMEQIANSFSAEKIINKLTHWLQKQRIGYNPNAIISNYISKTLTLKGNITIRDFCTEMQIHKSTLEKNFKQITGYTPKEYARIIRFNFLLNRMLFSKKNLTETCYEMGYFDQSHMIRDFQKMTGTKPSDFINKKFAIPKMAALAISNKRAHF